MESVISPSVLAKITNKDKEQGEEEAVSEKNSGSDRFTPAQAESGRNRNTEIKVKRLTQYFSTAPSPPQPKSRRQSQPSMAVASYGSAIRFVCFIILFTLC